MPCNHQQFKARASVTPPDENAGYSATITIKCGLCGQPFEFVGVSAEPSDERPMVAIGETELRVPLKPSTQIEIPECNVPCRGEWCTSIDCRCICHRARAQSELSGRVQ